MDFRLDDDQLALQDTVRAWCQHRYPLDGLAERSSGRLDRDAWSDLASLGVLSILVPSDRGGLGLGAVETTVVVEQLGAHLVPGPVLWSALAAAILHDERILTGDVVAGGAVDGGTAAYLEHAADLDVVLALRDEGAFAIGRPELSEPTPLDALDPLNPVSEVERLPAGRQVADAGAAAHLLRLATTLAAALQVGVAQTALDVAVAYSLEREQFGVPIGSFQALKHLMADMYVRVGLARSATYAAAAVLDDPSVGHAERSVSAAKLLAGDAAVDNARGAVQVLGGMGFTWDMAPHFLLKRAWALEQTFGTSSHHAHRIAESLSAEVA